MVSQHREPAPCLRLNDNVILLQDKESDMHLVYNAVSMDVFKVNELAYELLKFLESACRSISELSDYFEELVRVYEHSGNYFTSDIHSENIYFELKQFPFKLGIVKSYDEC